MATSSAAGPTARYIISLVIETLRPERSFIALAVIYGVGISFLSLATPIAVQVLINSVGYTALTVPLVVLSMSLFGLLLASGLLNALRVHLMELFARRIYARLTSKIALKALYAQQPFFGDDGRTSLFNRYFDIMLIQKAVPVLLIGGFTVLLQAAVGFILTAFYHPLFLAFNGVVVGLIWFIWLVWGASAIKSAVALSAKKHRSAAWIQALAASNGYFKSEEHISWALNRTNDVTQDWVDGHRHLFRRHFSQTLGFLVLYAVASAALLGLGGWLVIQGQLTLGQLVAAELVLAVAFYGVSQLGTYLNYFYDLCAASEELSLLNVIEEELPTYEEHPEIESSELVFSDVRGIARSQTAVIDLTIPSGKTIFARAESHGMQRLFTNLLKRFDQPKGGLLSLGGHDVTSLDVLALRRLVIVLDRPTMVEMSIRSYLALARSGASSAEMLDAIKTVGLIDALEDLEEGLDTCMSATGWPLSVSETMRLKLAGALLARPRVLVLNQLFDTVPEEAIRRALQHMRSLPGGGPTVIVFSAGRPRIPYDGYLWLGAGGQEFYPSAEALMHDQPPLGEHAQLETT